MIRALCLDFDGLIIDTETAFLDAVGDVHRAHQRLYDKRGLARAVGRVGVPLDLWKAFGPTAPRRTLQTELERFHAQRLAGLAVLPGVAELIAEARHRGVLVGCASNSRHDTVDAHLTRLGLWKSFDAVVCFEDVPNAKPAPDLYELLLRKLAVPPHEAVALEDSGTGVMAARAAGLWVAAVPNASTREHDFSAADAILDTLGGSTLATVFAAVRAGRKNPPPIPPATT